MPFDLSSLYGGIQDPRMQAMMQNRMQGQAMGQDMSWMDQPGALQMRENPFMAKMAQMQQRNPMPQAPGAEMPMAPMPEFSKDQRYIPQQGPPPGMQMPPRMPMPQMPQKPMLPQQAAPQAQNQMMRRPNLSSLRPQGGMPPPQTQQRPMQQRRRPMPTQAPSPMTQGPMTP